MHRGRYIYGEHVLPGDEVWASIRKYVHLEVSQILHLGNRVTNCFDRAWLFATGLVLGFSLLVEDVTNASERRTAFTKSLRVLGELRHLSPQAEQYYNILSSFHKAIKVYKERTQHKKRASRGTLVDCIFLPDVTTDVDESETDAAQLPSPEMTMQDVLSADWLDSLPLDTFNDPEPMDPLLMGDNDVIMRMLWESEKFALDYPVGMLPDADIDITASIQSLGTMLG